QQRTRLAAGGQGVLASTSLVTAGRRSSLPRDHASGEGWKAGQGCLSSGFQRRPRAPRDHSFLIACPPNSLRIEASSLSVNDSVSRERRRAISDRVITGAGTLSWIASSTVQRPSPESAT